MHRHHLHRRRRCFPPAPMCTTPIPKSTLLNNSNNNTRELEQQQQEELDLSYWPTHISHHQQQRQQRNHIPFLHVNQHNHKCHIRHHTLRGGTSTTMIKIFYTSRTARDLAASVLHDISEMLTFLAKDARHVLSNTHGDYTQREQELVMENLAFDGIDLNVYMVDTYAERGLYGVWISDRLFWEAYVMTSEYDSPEMDDGNDCDGPFGSAGTSDLETQILILNAVASDRCHVPHPLATVPVLMQMDAESPMSPQDLVLAWEKDNMVLPVDGVNSWDAFQERYMGAIPVRLGH